MNRIKEKFFELERELDAQSIIKMRNEVLRVYGEKEVKFVQSLEQSVIKILYNYGYVIKAKISHDLKD